MTVPFSRELIQALLERTELKYTVDDDGDFRIDFAAFAENAPEISVWITASIECRTKTVGSYTTA